MSNPILEELEYFRKAPSEERARILLQTPDSYLRTERRILAEDSVAGLPYLTAERKAEIVRMMLGEE